MAAVGNTEKSVVTGATGPVANTEEGLFQLFLDVADMIGGDVLEISVYEKQFAGGTQKKMLLTTLTGDQTIDLWASPLFFMKHGWDFTVKVTTGAVDLIANLRKFE
jgi:hypothetical protein